jgi:hypothetical protein
VTIVVLALCEVLRDNPQQRGLSQFMLAIPFYSHKLSLMSPLKIQVVCIILIQEFLASKSPRKLKYF